MNYHNLAVLLLVSICAGFVNFFMPLLYAFISGMAIGFCVVQWFPLFGDNDD